MDDNDLEFIIGSTQNLVNIDLKETSSSDGMWNTHRSNMKRTGYYESQQILEIVDNDIIDREFSIISAYPNPFNPSISIDYFIESSNYVEINIMNLQGKIIDNLESSFKSKGQHSIKWKPSNISSGVYLLNISTSNQTATQKIMFLK